MEPHLKRNDSIIRGEVKLTIETKILKEILKLAKPIINKDIYKEELRHVLLECVNNKLTVVAINGLSALVKEYECVSEENGKGLLPLFNLPGDLYEVVDIHTETENSISIDFGRTKITFTTPNPEEYFEYNTIFPKDVAEYEICFNAQLMAKICKDAGKSAKFYFYGKLRPCVIEAGNEKRLIMPTRMPED